jgi:hypothetical protein
MRKELDYDYDTEHIRGALILILDKHVFFFRWEIMVVTGVKNKYKITICLVILPNIIKLLICILIIYQ